MDRRPVRLLSMLCAEHRRMRPRPGVVLTLDGRDSWRNCQRCRVVWAEGHGPGSPRPDPRRDTDG